MQIPANPSMKPNNAFREMEILDLNNTMITSQSGNVAPMIEPSPAEIYFNPHVDNVLLRTKFRKVSIRTVIHSFPLGTDAPLAIKNMT